MFDSVNAVFSVLSWTVLLVFSIATAFWLVEVLLVERAPRGPIEYDLSEIEVRVMTVSAREVVQATVDSLPEGFAAVRVVAERDIDIEGATTHAVPEGFECEATRKARAVEWARRTVPCDSTFVLYLDEDTLLGDFHGLPDADVVQLSERPLRSLSWLADLAEIFRMGFQLEQATFPKFRYPLYAWGGGFAVKRELEDEITWDVNTVTEDTNFVWRAFEDPDRTLGYLDVRAMNQAPPSVREMVSQRRRWVSGAARDAHLLPLRYRLLSLFRNAAWALVLVAPLLALPLVTPIRNLFLSGVYRWLLLCQLVGLFGWTFLGYWYYGERLRVLVALLVSIPVVALLHSAGAFWAVLQPTTDFRATRKVPPSEVRDERIETAGVESRPPDRGDAPLPEVERLAGHGREDD